jgi:hypothetical protein
MATQRRFLSGSRSNSIAKPRRNTPNDRLIGNRHTDNPMTESTLTHYIDAKSQRWHVRLTYPGDLERPRPSLNIPAGQSPAGALRCHCKCPASRV